MILAQEWTIIQQAGLQTYEELCSFTRGQYYNSGSWLRQSIATTSHIIFHPHTHPFESPQISLSVYSSFYIHVGITSAYLDTISELQHC
jgi:hypothetical protein